MRAARVRTVAGEIMAVLSKAQRELVVEQLSAWMVARVLDQSNDVEFALTSGLHGEMGDDLEPPTPMPNGTWTLVVRINGGAQHTGSFTDILRRPGS